MSGSFRTDYLNVNEIVSLQEKRSIGNRVSADVSVHSFSVYSVVDVFRIVFMLRGSLDLKFDHGIHRKKRNAPNKSNHETHETHERRCQPKIVFRSAPIRVQKMLPRIKPQLTTCSSSRRSLVRTRLSLLCRQDLSSRSSLPQKLRASLFRCGCRRPFHRDVSAS